MCVWLSLGLRPEQGGSHWEKMHVKLFPVQYPRRGNTTGDCRPPQSQEKRKTTGLSYGYFQSALLSGIRLYVCWPLLFCAYVFCAKIKLYWLTFFDRLVLDCSRGYGSRPKQASSMLDCFNGFSLNQSVWFRIIQQKKPACPIRYKIIGIQWSFQGINAKHIFLFCSIMLCQIST